MRRAIALAVTTLVLACGAGPAFAMPVDRYGSPVQSGSAAPAAATPRIVTVTHTGTEALVVVLIGAGALLAGAAAGFTGARATGRTQAAG
jgi:hypothetical protein